MFGYYLLSEQDRYICWYMLFQHTYKYNYFKHLPRRLDSPQLHQDKNRKALGNRRGPFSVLISANLPQQPVIPEGFYRGSMILQAEKLDSRSEATRE
jgi:hypothetical protein